MEYGIEDIVAAAAPWIRRCSSSSTASRTSYNVGAILRSLDACGGHGAVRQARHAAALDGVVAKASAGAIATTRIATVVNIARAIDELKEAGVWTVGLAADAPDSYDAIDLTLPTAIVLGAEGSGLRRLVRERCDRLASIPMRGHVDQPECVCSGWGYAVRGGAAASQESWRMIFGFPCR